MLTWLGIDKEQLKSLRENAVDLTPFQRDEQGRYAWDRWELEAIAAGVDKDLAGLGRAVMREAVQHDWTKKLKAECGWKDTGKKMLALAHRDPAAAKERWGYLLDTDGDRGRWNEKTGDWVPFRKE